MGWDDDADDPDLLAELMEDVFADIGDADIIDIGERTLIYVEHIRDADDQLELELEAWEDEDKYETAAG